MLYRERLWPSSWIWILTVGLTASVGIAYGAAYGPTIGVLAFIPLTAIACVMLVSASPLIAVTPAQLRAGRACIPCSVLTRCAELDADGMRRALRLAEPDLYMLVRPWVMRKGVIIEVSDPADPHTSWVLSSRRPADVISALAAAGVDARATNGPLP